MATVRLLASLLMYLAVIDSAAVARWQWTGVTKDPITSPTTRTGTCKVDELLCSDGTCIPPGWICDFISDCPRGEDETDKLCGIGHTTSEGSTLNLGKSATPAANKKTPATDPQTLGPTSHHTTTSINEYSQITTTNYDVLSAGTTMSKTTNKRVTSSGKKLVGVSGEKSATQTDDGAVNSSTTIVEMNGTAPTEAVGNGYDRVAGVGFILALVFVAFL